MVLLFFGSTALALVFNADKPTILVLQSYGDDYVWTHLVNVGLGRVLDHTRGITIDYHYMHTKRFSDPDALRRAGIAARAAIDRIDPDVLIAVDDYAQSLAAKYYVNNPHLKIVFAGTNGSVKPYGYDKANNVTGILERKPAKALKEALLSLARIEGIQRPRAVYLADPSLSAKRDADYLAACNWGKVDYLPTRFVSTFDDWQAAVKTLSGRADFLLVGDYRKLHRSATDSSMVPAKEVMGWTEAHSAMPVVGMNVFNSADGAMLSIGVSPYEQGEWAAQTALSILHGTPPNKIPITKPSQYVVALRKSALVRRGLTIPTIYEAFARATNNYFP